MLLATSCRHRAMPQQVTRPMTFESWPPPGDNHARRQLAS
jgi:hypothetical protein